MFDTALAAASQILTPPFRTVLWKTLALTLALLGVVWIALHKLLVAGVALPYPWAATALSFIGGVSLFIGLAFLVAPVSFIVAMRHGYPSNSPPSRSVSILSRFCCCWFPA
jgi:CysZ protein